MLGMAPETSGSIGATWRRDIGAELYFSVGFDARYNLGLTNINNAGVNSIKNNTIQAGLFLKLGDRGVSKQG